MSETQQADTVYPGREQFEDEIELIDYLRVVWKRRYLIIAGALICAIAAGVISFLMPKVYRIDMVARPGILGIQPSGKHTYIDSPDNIKATVEAETFSREILDIIGESNSDDLPESLKLKVNIPKASNVLDVSYETANVDLGLRMMNLVRELLLKKYSERVAYFQNEYETQIGLKKTRVADCEAKRRTSKQHIKNIQKQIDELSSRIKLVRENSNLLIKERNTFLSNNTSESNILSAVLYTNTIQQNIAFENTCRQQVNDYVTKREDERLNLDKLNGESGRLLKEIKSLEFKKNNVQNIEILQPPTSSPYPIKPKKTLNVILAFVVGFFGMLFLAFFLEYVQGHRGEPHMGTSRRPCSP